MLLIFKSHLNLFYRPLMLLVQRVSYVAYAYHDGE